MTVPPGTHTPLPDPPRRSPLAGETLTVPERMIVAPGVGIFRPHAVADGARAASRRRDRRRRGSGHALPGPQPVRRHADGHAGAPGRASPLRSADRVVARRVSGLPVSVIGWGTAVPDARAVERRPRSDASTRTTRGSSSAPASASAASPRPGETASTLGAAAAGRRDQARRPLARPTSTCSSSRPRRPTRCCRTPARTSATRSACAAARST